MLVDMHLHEKTFSTDSFLSLDEIVSIAKCSWSIKKHYKTSNEAALLCRNKAATTFPDISSVVVAVFL